MTKNAGMKKGSMKVYKAVRKAIKKSEPSSTIVFIAGRRRGVHGAHMTMWMIDDAGIWQYHGEWYFTSKPKTKEVKWAMSVMKRIENVG